MRGMMSTITAVDNHPHIEVGLRVTTRTATTPDWHPRTETWIADGIKTFASLPHASLTSVVVMTNVHTTKYKRKNPVVTLALRKIIMNGMRCLVDLHAY